MCEFISWKKNSDNRVFFLTDNDVFSSHGRETLGGTRDNDALGHGAIDAFYGRATRDLPQFEDKDFWRKANFPPEIAVHLESPETLLNAWGKMLRRYLQLDDVYYILRHAPEPWRSALLDICIGHIAKDPRRAYFTLFYGEGFYVKDLTEAQKDILVEGAARDPDCAYRILRDVQGLTEAQKDILVEGAAKDPEYAYYTLRYIQGLTEAQKDILVKGAARDPEYAYRTLRYVRGLTEAQKALLKR